MVLTFVAFSLAKPDAFLSWWTIKSLFRDMVPLLVVALGATVVLIMGDFDLSIGGSVGLCGTVTIIAMSGAYFGLPLPAAIVIGLCVGAACGLFNGTVIAYVGASSFIVTLAMGILFQGLDLALLHSRTIFEEIPEAYGAITTTDIAGFSSQTIVGLVVLLLAEVLLAQTELGRHMYAVGGNSEAARLSGLNVKRLRALGFVLVGVCAAIAGVLISSQAGAANPNSGTGLLLPAYAAAFLGSTMWRVGRFTAIGTFLGALFLQVIGTGLSMFNLGGPLVMIIQGAILVLAVVASKIGRTTDE